MDKLISEPATAVVEEGLVLLDGRPGLALSFTPRAARESARRLLVAARHAMGRNHRADKP